MAALRPWTRFRKIILFLVLGTPVILYLGLLTANFYSARRTAKMLNALESLRVGDPASRFYAAIRGCKTDKTPPPYDCMAVAEPLSFDWLQRAAWKAPNAEAFNNLLSAAGLRGHFFIVNGIVEHEQIQEVGVTLIVAGRYESLGVKWAITGSREHLLNPEESRAYGRMFHITSQVGGEGFGFSATPATTEAELGMRHANPRCLFSFRGCESLCELLPNAIPTLKDRLGPDACDWVQRVRRFRANLK
jgi:hypothetical protein